MTDVANAIRRATLAATRLHRDLNLQARVPRENGRVDVFDALARLNVPLIFKPLDGLLGAYLADPVPGVLVTTKRPLSVQRFTAAHELGHHRLGHKPSLDDDSILRRAPFVAQTGVNPQEIEADAFAAAFLLPRWLVGWHCDRQGWDDSALHRPEVVYQLALRAGTSYAAACWTLQRYDILDRTAAREMATIEPKTIKKALLGDIQPENYYSDVWFLTDRDAGLQVEGGPSDLFVVSLPEHSGAGYLWRFEDLDADGFAIMEDRRENADPDGTVGSHVTRRITTQSRRRQSGEVRLAEGRPWQPNVPLSTYVVRYDLAGAEAEGWSRAERRFRLEAA